MNRSDDSQRSALVAVLGDLGRSPRMLNHARVLLARGWTVTLAGLRETELPEDLTDHPALKILAAGLPIEAEGSVRMRARWRLWMKLARSPERWSLAIVQNPPAFPLLAALMIGRARTKNSVRLRIVVDWHNLGYTLLVQAGRGRAAVFCYRVLERFFARRADAHWAVSTALAEQVRDWVGITKVTVLRDQPPAWLVTAARVAESRMVWWRRWMPEVELPAEGARWLVMPSSWTRDEAIELFLDAVKIISEGGVSWPEGGRVVLIATGRGARRKEFTERFPEQPAIALRTAWLAAESYAELLGHADAGLCLHASSSKLDLPMKLADMRGARLPALVFNYGEVLDEIFIQGDAGILFRTAHELAGLIAALAADPPSRLRSAGSTWEEAWAALAPAIEATPRARRN